MLLGLVKKFWFRHKMMKAWEMAKKGKSVGEIMKATKLPYALAQHIIILVHMGKRGEMLFKQLLARI